MKRSSEEKKGTDPKKKAKTKGTPKKTEADKKPKPKAAKAKSDVPATGNIYPKPVVVPLPASITTGTVDRSRIRVLNAGDLNHAEGPVVYWMSRDQRVQDNWALLFAHHLAQEGSRPCVVVFNVVTSFLNAPLRHFDFMLTGLEEVEKGLKKLNYPFYVLTGDPAVNLPAFLARTKASSLVTDYSPMHLGRTWKREVAAGVECPFYEVDAHNIVPPWVSSDKQEWSAATFRKRIHKHLPDYFVAFPELPPQAPAQATGAQAQAEGKGAGKGAGEGCGEGGTMQGGARAVDWRAVRKQLQCDASIGPVDWCKGGETAAHANLKAFLSERLLRFSEDRNVPSLAACSNMSPWLHYGHIAPQRVAWEASKYKSKCKEGFASFFEELVVRRELSDNFCHYNPHYDKYEGLPPWAKITHGLHAKDKREHLYTDEQLEQGRTHDELWNAAQDELVTAGKMHGFLRMYWAKKILEWTPSAEHALGLAVRQNDKYSLDGRDPNGYVGCCWAIGGVHDRAWGPERTVFGKIRYMNYAGCKRKFDIKAYVAKILALKKKLKK